MGQGLVIMAKKKKGSRRKRFTNIPIIRALFAASYGNFVAVDAFQQAGGNLENTFGHMQDRLRQSIDPNTSQFRDFTVPLIGSQIAGVLADKFNINPNMVIRGKGKKFRIKIL